MIWRIVLSLLLAFIQALAIGASTNSNDHAALKALKDTWTNVPPNWVGSDPCGDVWDGITCKNDRVVSITLASINLIGQLSSDISGLTELQTLDLSYNKGMTGSLPSGIGDVKKLSSLSLNSNNFIGSIPPSIGNLLNLYWLDLADNKLTGTIPVSDGTSPGLDMLIHTKHFHFGKNQLSGVIPPQLFHSNLTLIHLLFENNQLTGSIPYTMGLVDKLEVVRLDRNSLSGPVPSNFNNLTSVQELDMSNNSFDVTDIPPWFSSLQSMTSLVMENTKLQGSLPVSMFSLFQLQTV
ncbi:PREDICTED: probable leucine-rich repeat receptor-like protein kinase At5g49770 [Erythranthe guttata]|uniref:probable leucine-rich repeat receptor-like protein kinase At5g49770 n=1 Tax=Erythranthe guttata TaxID=4155 RepID=UPI00064DE8CF|nr:PREDICTED: probable leucine-rich repeat receptor-like protein kinase At5g49770 [Erythranthe guttata]|eukprot:XP_012842360.1 PREDICTED: probable leucine-rich repeat receptor-like protein kinase At5g49770 [Erythranthe guttata]